MAENFCSVMVTSCQQAATKNGLSLFHFIPFAMHPTLLQKLIKITGLPMEYILQQCHRLRMYNQTILDFYLVYRRFPTKREAELITDIGLPNFHYLKSVGF